MSPDQEAKNRRQMPQKPNLTGLPGEHVVSFLASEKTVTFLMGSHYPPPFPSGNECEKTIVWVIGGRAQTDSEGQAIIDLNDHLYPCHHSGPDVYRQYTSCPAFVATPSKNTPVLLSTATKMEVSDMSSDHFIATDLDGNIIALGRRAFDSVKVEVMSWNLDGTAAPRVTFSWTCVVSGQQTYPRPG